MGVWGGFACTGELDSQVELYLVSGGSRSSRLVSVEIGSANVGGGQIEEENIFGDLDCQVLYSSGCYMTLYRVKELMILPTQHWSCITSDHTPSPQKQLHAICLMSD